MKVESCPLYNPWVLRGLTDLSEIREDSEELSPPHSSLEKTDQTHDVRIYTGGSPKMFQYNLILLPNIVFHTWPLTPTHRETKYATVDVFIFKFNLFIEKLKTEFSKKRYVPYFYFQIYIIWQTEYLAV